MSHDRSLRTYVYLRLLYLSVHRLIGVMAVNEILAIGRKKGKKDMLTKEDGSDRLREHEEREGNLHVVTVLLGNVSLIAIGRKEKKNNIKKDNLLTSSYSDDIVPQIH